MRRQHATEVLRPWTVYGTVENDPTNVASSELLGIRRKPQECVNLAVGVNLHRLC